MPRRLGFLLLPAACAVACGSTWDTSNGVADADAPVDAPADAGACYALQTPESWRACASSADCEVGLTEVDHCGTERAVGFASASFAQFQQAETAMEHRCPQGSCAPGNTIADDGTTGAFASKPGVACALDADTGTGICTTSYDVSDAGGGGAPDAGID